MLNNIYVVSTNRWQLRFYSIQSNWSIFVPVASTTVHEHAKKAMRNVDEAKWRVTGNQITASISKEAVGAV